MATDFELMLFEQELSEVRALPEAIRWKLERDPTVPLGLTVEVHSVKDPAEVFLARIRWDDYFKAPSLKFLNRQTLADTDVRAWPQCRGFRPSSLDACVSWTAEGQKLHPEWSSSPRTAFPQVESPMQYILLTLQNEMDMFFTGRAQP
jgi:hypothetical protein